MRFQVIYRTQGLEDEYQIIAPFLWHAGEKVGGESEFWHGRLQLDAMQVADVVLLRRRRFSQSVVAVLHDQL